ncbi:MAG: ferredoxin family protein [Planctomycetes bacterium]|nr:ferredoxin family protein [Planctomycetota bacterium]
MDGTPQAESPQFWRKPIDEGKAPKLVGVVLMIPERCKGCGWCVEFCPRKVLVISERFNIKGYHYPRVAKPEECVDCRLCERLCPEFAIYLKRSPAQGGS